MIEFKMIITCKWCWSGDDHIPGGNAIELYPTPVYFNYEEDKYTGDHVLSVPKVDTERQRELIFRHGWVLEGDLTFCCEGCRSEYLDEKNINDEGGEDEDD